MSIYITEKDQAAVDIFRSDISGTSLYKSGCVHFVRPDLGKLIETHTLGMIGSREYSTSLLTFCGSPILARFLREKNTDLELLTTVTGHSDHTMHFLAEDYGGPKVVHRERSAVVGVSLDPDSHANEEEDKSKSAMNLWSVVQNETDRIVTAKRTEQFL